MKPNDEMQVREKCRDCDLVRAGFFCEMALDQRSNLEELKVTKIFPRGSRLFIEGQSAHGVYMLCQGRVKLSTCSTEGRVIILDIAHPGNLLGLSAAISGCDYEVSAEAIDLCQVNYIPSEALMRLLSEHPGAAMNAARQLSRNYQTAYNQICSLGLSETAIEKLGRLFLSWTQGLPEEGPVTIQNMFTHEEIAEMIGATRETVTRTIKLFKERELISIKGMELTVTDRRKLRSMVKSNT